MRRMLVAVGTIAVISLAAYGVVQAGLWDPGPLLDKARATLATKPAVPATATSRPAAVVVVPSTRPVPSRTPVTEVATTRPPTDGAQTVGQAPRLAAPVAASPVAQAPAAPVVVAQAPVAQTPATQTPVAQSPATQSPATQVPATQVPAIQIAQAPAATAPAAAAAPLAAPAPLPASAPKSVACANPNAMGVTRTVEIDTTGGPGFGSQHFKSYDFLRDHEVVLTFDDGPWLNNTQAVLKALADQCLHATFFPIGKHATYYPEILKLDIAAGHTVGSHTWSHADLQAVVKKGGIDAAKDEIEKGASAVRMMAGAPIAPFFRFPDLRHPPEMVTYLGERNIAIFSTDIDSWDFKIKKPEELIKSVMGKLTKAGKGIILMHDFQKVTATALPQLLGQMQKNGFKIVHMVPRGTLTTLPQYDDEVLKENKLPTVANRPTESVVRTIGEQ
jgi:peptidoglycan/xylan/chitin deacetylase (PgdA/CDA1 family)